MMVVLNMEGVVRQDRQPQTLRSMSQRLTFEAELSAFCVEECTSRTGTSFFVSTSYS